MTAPDAHKGKENAARMEALRNALSNAYDHALLEAIAVSRFRTTNQGFYAALRNAIAYIDQVSPETVQNWFEKGIPYPNKDKK